MRTSVAVALALLAAVPALLVRLTGASVPVEPATLLFGLAIVGASFAMAWGAEAAEHDIPRALALTVVALLAVFPEYAVDIVFAFKAGQDPEFAPYAAANMTGSNRLLLGLGWPTVSVLAWLARGQSRLQLTRAARQSRCRDGPPVVGQVEPVDPAGRQFATGLLGRRGPVRGAPPRSTPGCRSVDHCRPGPLRSGGPG